MARSTLRNAAGPAVLLLLAAAAVAEEPLSDEFQLNVTTAGAQWAPHADADDAGNFVATWVNGSRASLAGDIVARRFDVDGTALGPEIWVTTAPGHQEQPQVAVNASGAFAVAWEDRSGSPDFDVQARVFDSSGNPLGPAFLAHPPSGGVQFAPAIAMADDGSFIIAWQDDSRDCDQHGIFAQRFDAAGVPIGPDFQLSEQCSNLQRNPELAMAGDGSWAVAWEAAGQPEDDDGWASFVRFFNADGTARSGDILANEVTMLSQWEPRIAMNDAGRTFVAWASEHDGESDKWNDVRGRVFDGFGNPLTSEFPVSVTGADDSAPSIWGDQQFRPLLAVAEDGSLLATWRDNANDEHDSDGSNGVYAHAHWPDGLGTCEDWLVNQTIVGEQGVGGIAMRPDGLRHAIVWDDSTGNDGGGWGIFARLYGTTLPDLPLPMGCFAANCAKIQLGTGQGDGKVTAKGNLRLNYCTAVKPEGVLHPPVADDDLVQVLIDGQLVFAAPLSDFDNARNELFKYRGAAGGMQIDFDSGAWKFVDRRSVVGGGAVDPTDGIDFEIRIGPQSGLQHLTVDWKPARGLAQHCLHGGDQVDCP